VLVDVKLDQDEGPRPEVELRDFELCSELRRLMSRFDGIKNGKVARLEIRSGVPRRAIFESTMTGGPLKAITVITMPETMGEC
jgi:hypothetical protein